MNKEKFLKMQRIPSLRHDFSKHGDCSDEDCHGYNEGHDHEEEEDEYEFISEEDCV